MSQKGICFRGIGQAALREIARATAFSAESLETLAQRGAQIGRQSLGLREDDVPAFSADQECNDVIYRSEARGE